MQAQRLLVRQDVIQTTIESILVGEARIDAEQLVHRRSVEPEPVQTELRAGIDQAIDDQQLQHQMPGHLGALIEQARREELGEAKFTPEFTREPAVAEGARAKQLQLGDTQRDRIERIGGDFAIIGKEAGGGVALAIFIEDVEGFSPGDLLRVVDFAEVEDLALVRFPIGQPTILDDGEVAVKLAVLSACDGSKKHPVSMATPDRNWQEGRSSPHRLLE